MKSSLHSPHNLSATGVGPKIFRSMLPFLLAGITVQIFLPAYAAFPFKSMELFAIAGWILLVTGILLWVFAIIQFAIGFPKGKLITTGVYSLSRNPIYAAWIVFILPALAGIWNNWIFLLAALAMYIAFIRVIGEEEKMLAQIFGEHYQTYMKKVNRVLF